MTTEQITLLLKMQSDLRGALEASRAAKEMDRNFAGVSRSLSSVARGFVGILGVGLSVGGLGALARSSAQFAAEIRNLAAQSGIGTQAFQTLSNLAAESGVKQQQLSVALVTLRRNLQEAAENGAHPLNTALATLGLTAAGLQAIAPERQFEMLGRAIRGAKDEQAALNAATDLLGKENAPRLLTTLRALAEQGYGAVEEKLSHLNLTDKQLADLDAAGNKLERIALALKLIGARGVNAVVGAFDNANTGGPTDGLQRELARLETLGQGSSGEAVALRGALENLQRRAALQAIGSYTGRGMTPADVEAVEVERKMREAGAAAAADARRAEQQAKELAAASAHITAQRAAMAEASKETKADRAATVARLEAERRARAVGAIEAGDDRLRDIQRQRAAAEQNPYLTTRELSAERVRWIERENAEIETQIQLNRELASLLPEQRALLMGQNRELGNRIADNGLALGGERDPIRGLELFGRELRQIGQEADPMFDLLNNGFFALQGGIADSLRNAEDFGDGMERILYSVGEALIETAAQALALQAATSIFGMFGIKGFAGGGYVGGTQSIGTYATGGYTGAGSLTEAAGIVHRGEFVLPADVTRKIGVGNLYGTMAAARSGDVGTFSGSRTLVVNQEINVSAGVAGQVRAELVSMLPMFRQLAHDSVREAEIRGT